MHLTPASIDSVSATLDYLHRAVPRPVTHITPTDTPPRESIEIRCLLIFD